jgi:hypothetical protein
MIHMYIDVQKCDFRGGGVPGELDGIAAVEAFKEHQMMSNPSPPTLKTPNIS